MWPLHPIKSVALGIFDGPHATPKRRESGSVFLGISSLDRGRIDLAKSDHVSEPDFAKWTRRVTPAEGDLVFSYETRIGEAASIPRGLRCCLGRRMGLVRPDPAKMDARFLLYSYLGPEFQEVLRERTVQGSTVERILLTEFPDFPIRVPPLDEQRRIAAVLGALDDKIELNRKMNRTLEEMAQAIFKSWFIDFDGHDDLVDSEIGPVPRGWRVAGLDAVAYNVRDGVHPGDVDAELAYVGLEHVPRRCAALAEWGRAADVDSGKARFARGDLLFGKLRPYFHKVVPVWFEGMASTDILVVRPQRAEWRWFSFGHLFSDALVAHATAASDGTKMPRTRWSDLCRWKVAIPPIEVAKKFDGIAEPLYRRVFANVRESRTLATLRDTLLPKLISGELRVFDAAALVEAAS